MPDQIQSDILKLFRANPLLRDTDEVLATRLGRALPHVQKALEELEAAGIVSRRWVGNAGMYFFTGAPVAETTGEEESEGVNHKAEVGRDEVVPLLSAYLRIPSTLEAVQKARAAIEGMCRGVGMTPASVMEFAITVSEALTNAHRYGRRGDGRDIIRMTFKLLDGKVELIVKDRGSGFPFLLVGAAHGDVKSTGGRGLMLMRSLADELEIKRTPTGTVVRLVKNLQPLAPAEPA